VLAVRSSLVDLAPPAGAFTVVRCGPDVDSAHVAAVLSGLEPPPDGTSVLGGGVPLAAVDRDALRRHVGAGAGEARLLRGPLRDDLLAGRADRAQRLDRALWAACADEALEHVPGGLDGDVHDRGWSLSGGQRQRFALARLLAADPDVLVLHDPTSAVDAHTEALIACRLREARRGRTTIVVSRSALLAEVADRVVELSAERR
jgi:putative ABC transport system ATP-binding protein